MGSRWQRFLAEVGRFLAVGGLATIVALILFNWLVHGYTTGREYVNSIPTPSLINIVTMGLPVGCLWLSRNALGLDDPSSDNISANVIGLAMGLVARFYLFRRFVFRRPVHLPHLPRTHEPVSEPTARSTSDPARRPAP